MHEIIIDEIKTLFSSEFKNIKIGIKKYATRADNELILNNFVIKSQVTRLNIPTNKSKQSIIPKPVATPLPPLNFSQIGKQ